MGQDRDEKKNNRESEQGERKPWDIRPYLSVALTAIFIVLVCMIAFFLLYRLGDIAKGLTDIFNALAGVWIGLFVAFLINPIMKAFEKPLAKKICKGSVPTGKQFTKIRALSVAIAMGIFIAVVAVFLGMVVPTLVESVQDLLRTLNEKIEALSQFVSNLMGDFLSEEDAQATLTSLTDYVVNWVEKHFDAGGDLISSIASGAYAVAKSILNVLIGFIVSVYVLMKKEMFIAQGKKIVYAVFRKRWGNHVMEVIYKADEAFDGFLIGKIIDSIIIGAIAFVVLYVTNMPYSPLLAAIIGVTNVIPVFGPFLGAVPCAVIVFLDNPISTVWFVIFIIILQQIDGNIIGPKILGSSVGISPFWIVFSIILFGVNFGVLGMFFAVPAWTVIYYIVKRIVEYILRKIGMPDDTMAYMHAGRVDIESGELLRHDAEAQGSAAKRFGIFKLFKKSEKSGKAGPDEGEGKEQEKEPEGSDGAVK